jgi:hypothetical protein
MRPIKSTWRFFLGAAIGAGVGYALVLLTQPARRNPPPGWRVLYQAGREEREEQTAGQ